MTLVDTGPLVAILDASERGHGECVQALAEIAVPLVTTWPVLTEAMHFISRRGDRGVAALWRLVTTGRLELVDLDAKAVERTRALMAKYADLPMDLADASLVAVAEQRSDRTIFTLDSDFTVYRLNGKSRFRVVPTMN